MYSSAGKASVSDNFNFLQVIFGNEMDDRVLKQASKFHPIDRFISVMVTPNQNAVNNVPFVPALCRVLVLPILLTEEIP